ncbi:MAG: hypothetical protein ACOYL1_04125 [Chlamydiia bacterium]
MRSSDTLLKWNTAPLEQCPFLEKIIAFTKEDKGLANFVHFGLAQGFPNELFRQLFLELNTLELSQSSVFSSRLLSLETKGNLVSIESIITPFVLRENDEIKNHITLSGRIQLDIKTRNVTAEAYAYFFSPKSSYLASDPAFSKRFSPLAS